MTRLSLFLSLLVACGGDEAPESESTEAENQECVRSAASFWSEVEQLEPSVFSDPPSIGTPVIATDPAPLERDYERYRYLHIVIDPNVVTLEGRRLADSESISDGNSAPEILTTQLDRMRESGLPFQIHIQADGSVAAGTLGSLLRAIGDRAEVTVLAYESAGDNPRGIPDSFFAELPRLTELTGDARRGAVEAAARQATENCPGMLVAMKAMMSAVLPVDAASSAPRLSRDHFRTTIEEQLVACNCGLDLDELLEWYRASSLNRWGRLGAATVELPANASQWAGKTIDEVVD